MLIYVTNRNLCKDDFLNRIACLASGKPHAIILREKDLSPEDYQALAEKVKVICDSAGVQLIINKYIMVAKNLGISSVHVSLEDFKKYRDALQSISKVVVSVHSAKEAQEACNSGASALIAGHIYETDCKKGLAPRGLDFFREVCNSVSIPVFGIGGITQNRVKEVTEAGANGVCIMSEAMTYLSPSSLSSRILSFTLEDSCYTVTDCYYNKHGGK
ncbi:thiamine phosphate synthase [Ruminiclostridium papyrosolvens]|uniref:Thiamine monophosphate synthase n=1 Tax=Ruminiclostridium papyrosolvens C7 TaxID=1330534 RepID=U4R3A7_9FIRM|nr:thiamine phosphate synthase [Ruminiclostridium papyrosolvens]EPR12204.1 thiamine monophosphate synthase [Ruminiclostridium papyrosolvens C7]